LLDPLLIAANTSHAELSSLIRRGGESAEIEAA